MRVRARLHLPKAALNKKPGFVVLVCVLCGLLQGCETFASLGRDVQQLGKTIERKASEKQR
jgi:predicted small secreted protein